jgi:hypothetical protein
MNITLLHIWMLIFGGALIVYSCFLLETEHESTIFVQKSQKILVVDEETKESWYMFKLNGQWVNIPNSSINLKAEK